MALKKVKEELWLSREDGAFDSEALLQEVNKELSRVSTAKPAASTHAAKHGPASGSYTGNPNDYLLTKCAADRNPCVIDA